MVAAFALFAAAHMNASSITSFDFAVEPSSPFTTNLTSSFTSTEATVTGTIACESTTKCAGGLATFDVGLDLSGISTSSLTISGELTGDREAFGVLTITSPTFLPFLPFTIPLGTFDKTIVSSGDLPQIGLIDLKGSIDLGMLPGQTLTLPLTISINNVPEPSGQVLLLVAALGCAGFVRSRYWARNRSSSKT
jgi:hypothetical protein